MCYTLFVAKARFTWDPVKAEKNLRGHLVSFDEAKTVFDDKLASFDKDWAKGEKRLLVIGMSSLGRLLYVICTADESGRAFHTAHARPPRRNGGRMKKVSKRRTPTAAQLRDIPEISDTRVRLGRGAEGLKRATAEFLTSSKNGRPKKGTKADGSRPRSVRLPDATWDALEKRAESRGVTVHALLREAVAKLLKAKAA